MDSRTAKNYLDHLDTKLETYREKAADVLSRNSTFSRFGSLKISLVQESEKLAREREELEQTARDGQLSDSAIATFQARQDALVRRAREEAQDATDKIRSIFGVDEIPDEPISDQAFKRLSLYLAQIGRVSDGELARKIASAALDGDRATVQVLRDEVQRRLDSLDGPEPHQTHPLKVAERAVEVASANHQTVAAEMAAEKAANLEDQLETVVRTVEERGRWEGPAATVQPRTTKDLPIVGRDEAEAFARHSSGDLQKEAEAALEDLPTVDPILPQDDDTPDPAEAREARIRDRIQNRGG